MARKPRKVVIQITDDMLEAAGKVIWDDQEQLALAIQ